jgi:hypothetical protein
MASVAPVVQGELYLYGITLAEPGDPGLAPGVAGTAVEQIVDGPLAAVVGRLSFNARKIRPQRANLAAHHQVLRQLADRQPVLPVAFGTLAESEERLRGILRRNRAILESRLRRLRGAAEMALKVFWETANIFELFVATHQELEQVRNRLFRPGRTPTMEEKLAVGKLFESLVQESRQRHTKRVTEALAPHCLEVRALDCREERLIMKLACLIQKDRQSRWEEGVEQAAKLFDNHYCFQYSGPWAPYNFAEIDLELDL